MEDLNNQVEGSTWDIFDVVKLANQKYAEVETKFVRRHLRQLFEFWKIKKTDTEYHKLKFKQDYDNPLILIQGNNVYEISEIYDLDQARHIPAFHSRSLHPTETAYFDLDVTLSHAISTKTSVDSEFATFLIQKNFEELILCGDDGKKATMKVLNLPHHHCIKLGRNWYDICDWQKCKTGDVLRFKFHNERFKPINRCHIYKL